MEFQLFTNYLIRTTIILTVLAIPAGFLIRELCGVYEARRKLGATPQQASSIWENILGVLCWIIIAGAVVGWILSICASLAIYS